MKIEELPNVPVSMIKHSLEEIPFFKIPCSFTIRKFESGDEQLWLDIQSRSDSLNEISLDLFQESFGQSFNLLKKRQFYMLDRQLNAIATGTAWFYNSYKNLDYGRIHWLAVLPEFQGLGMGKYLLAHLCRTLGELGHNRAYLRTSTQRIPAIKLYLKFGFIPEIETASDAKVWNQLSEKLNVSIKNSKFDY